MKLDKSYSQYGEDVAAALQFPNWPTNGRILEIGAWHPEQFSNSRAFIEAGWGAVLIEPSPGPLKALIKAYDASDKVQIISAAVVLPNGPRLIAMHVTDDAVSTNDGVNYEAWKDAVKYYGLAWFSTIPLDHISVQFGHFDICSIDCEGASADLFICAVRDLGWRPRVYIVEYDQRLGEILQIATECGYKAVMSNGTNVVLAR